MMWLAMRLEYWMSFWRCSTSQIVAGSGPVGFHICTAKISELRRGSSSKIGLGRRIRKNAAVPMELAVDPDRRKRRRQRARGQDVLDLDLGFATVEIVHHARSHMRGPDYQARAVAVDDGEIDEFGK